MLGLLTGRVPDERAAGDGEEPWQESETHEGCSIFGYVDVSPRAGTLQ